MGYCACCGRVTLTGCVIPHHESHVYAYVLWTMGWKWDENGNLVERCLT